LEQKGELAAAEKRMAQMQLVESPHQRTMDFRDRLRLVIERRARQRQQLALPSDRELGMMAVDHRFALSKPALVSARSKKSFSIVICPILACSSFSRASCVSVGGAPSPNTTAAFSISSAFHWVIWLG